MLTTQNVMNWYDLSSVSYSCILKVTKCQFDSLSLSRMVEKQPLERIYDFQFMYIIWLLVVYLTYFMKPVKETVFSSKIHEAFFANIRNDCVFSVIKNKQYSYAIRVWALSS